MPARTCEVRFSEERRKTGGMQIDTDKASAREIYGHMVSAITPRPIAWVSTISGRGITNLAPFSFFNGVCANPPTLCFSAVNNRRGERKDTVRNIEAVPQFVVNVVSADVASAMNQTAAELPYEVSEFQHAGLTEETSQRVRPPGVREAHVRFECELAQIVPVGEGPMAASLVLGRIVLIHIDDTILDAAGAIDPARLDTIGRLAGSLYCYTRDRFALDRP